MVSDPTLRLTIRIAPAVEEVLVCDLHDNFVAGIIAAQQIYLLIGDQRSHAFILAKTQLLPGYEPEG